MPDPRPDPAETTGLPNTPSPDSTGVTVEQAPSQRPIRPPEPIPDIPGYAIESVLGRGGMGVVYRARQIAANRPVALKMILGGELAGEDERNRLRTEAESIARLNHPNIVQIYEVGEYRGVPFFSMEFCAGGSLAQHLAGNPMKAGAAARLVARLAGAIGCAHAAGVVHRDLKPANILLARGDVSAQSDTRPEQSTRERGKSSRSSQGGRRGSTAHADGSGDHGSELLPKVTDFGLAKHLDAGPGQTRSGQVMGTPSYMAPEQALGDTKNVGPLADVYALGAILYECLTGRPPFRAATTLETLD
jgi:eukaryotic-like serine/threonine-protein kinase